MQRPFSLLACFKSNPHAPSFRAPRIIVSCFLRYACENVNKLLVGNKSDLEAKRAVTTEEAKVCVVY